MSVYVRLIQACIGNAFRNLLFPLTWEPCVFKEEYRRRSVEENREEAPETCSRFRKTLAGSLPALGLVRRSELLRKRSMVSGQEILPRCVNRGRFSFVDGSMAARRASWLWHFLFGDGASISILTNRSTFGRLTAEQRSNDCRPKGGAYG